MVTIKVLGSGCVNCKRLAQLVQQVAVENAIHIQLDKVTDYAAIAGYGIASTPGVVVDGKVVHAGGLPQAANVATWLTS